MYFNISVNSAKMNENSKNPRSAEFLCRELQVYIYKKNILYTKNCYYLFLEKLTMYKFKCRKVDRESEKFANGYILRVEER